MDRRGRVASIRSRHRAIAGAAVASCKRVGRDESETIAGRENERRAAHSHLIAEIARDCVQPRSRVIALRPVATALCEHQGFACGEGIAASHEQIC